MTAFGFQEHREGVALVIAPDEGETGTVDRFVLSGPQAMGLFTQLGEVLAGEGVPGRVERPRFRYCKLGRLCPFCNGERLRASWSRRYSADNTRGWIQGVVMGAVAAGLAQVLMHWFGWTG